MAVSSALSSLEVDLGQRDLAKRKPVCCRTVFGYTTEPGLGFDSSSTAVPAQEAGMLTKIDIPLVGPSADHNYSVLLPQSFQKNGYGFTAFNSIRDISV